MSEELTIDAIEEKFKDEWVVVEVTKRDRYHVPVAGRALFHHKDREKMLAFRKQYRQQGNPEKELYFFFTGNPFPEDAAVILNAI